MLQFRPQAQAGQQGFAQKSPTGDNGQEMRFVNDNQMVVDVQDFFFKRNDGFAVAAGFAVIKHGFARLEQRVFVKRRAVCIDDEAAVQTPAPVVLADKGKADAEKMQQGQAVKRFFVRQHQIAGFDAV